MLKSLIKHMTCMLFGHLDGVAEACPYTNNTYITCIRCDLIIDAYKTPENV